MQVIFNFFLSRVLPQKAVEVMCVVPKRCNDMMNVGRLQGFDVSLPLVPLIVCECFQNK